MVTSSLIMLGPAPCMLLEVAAGLLCAFWTGLFVGWSQRVWKFKCLSCSHMLSTAGTTPEVPKATSHHGQVLQETEKGLT